MNLGFERPINWRQGAHITLENSQNTMCLEWGTQLQIHDCGTLVTRTQEVGMRGELVGSIGMACSPNTNVIVNL